MRLLHTKDLVFKDFIEREIPPYAILSHRWGRDEVSYQEFRCLTEVDENKRRALELLWNVSDAKKYGKCWFHRGRSLPCLVVHDH